MKLHQFLCAGLALSVLLTVPALAAPAEDGGTEPEAACYTQTDLDAAYAAGQSAGYNEGYQLGLSAGQASAGGSDYDAGYQAGYQAAYELFQAWLEDGGGGQVVTSEGTGSEVVSASTGFDVGIVLPENEDHVINVRVPSNGHILINPYGLETASDLGVTTDQVISGALTIENYSDVALNVSASATGSFTEGSDARFVDLPTALFGKSLFLYFEFWRDAYGGAIPWHDGWSAERNQLVVNTGAAEVMTLDAAKDGVPDCGAFRAFGSTSIPEEGAWASGDTLGVTLIFTFTVAE